MDCTTAREELLDAAPNELGGAANTELASHLRHCPRCGPLASVLLAEQGRLGAAIAHVQPRLTSAAAASEILAAQSVRHRAPDSRRDRIGRFVAAAFPMAAAAALAAYLVYGNREPVPRTAGTFRESPANAVRITAPPGTGTIVLNTGDPDITFAWIGKEIVP